MRAIGVVAATTALLLVSLGTAVPSYAAVPGTPTAVTATGGAEAITVSWTAPATDGGSVIWRYMAQAYSTADGSSAVSGCSTADGSTYTCTIPDLAAGTTYYVGVQARNDDGWSSESSRVTATTTNLPGSPRSVTLSRILGGVAVSWSAPSNASSAPVTGYTATAYSSSASSSALASCTTSGLSCSITGLDSTATVYVSVTATTAAGTSSPSSRVSISPGSLPGVPMNVKAPRGNGYSRVTWSAPASTGGSTITGYTVRAWTAAENGNLVASCQPVKVTTLACDLGPLPNGTTYYIDVVATTAMGDSAPSSPRVSVRTATTPTVPRSVSATRSGPDVVVRWSVPETDGGMPITSYVASAYAYPTGGSALATCTTDGPTCSIAGLKGAPVHVSVIARTEAGDSPATAPRIQVRLIAPSDAVTAVAGSARPQGLAVSWNPPANDGGKPVLSYTATAYTSPTGGTAASSCEVRVSGRQAQVAKAGSAQRAGCTIAGLSPKAVYYVEVGATTEFGTTKTPQRTAVRVRQAKPLQPLDVRGIPADHQIVVSWALPASDGGSPILDYRAQAWSKQHGGRLVDECVVAARAQAPRASCVIDVPLQFEPYWVQVVARNARGTGMPSSRMHLEANPAVPSVPEHVVVHPVSAGLLVDWDPPIGDGGYPIYRYIAVAYDAPTAGAKLGSCMVSVKPRTAVTENTPTKCVIAGLAADRYVYVDVTAENTVGVSSPTPRVPSAATVVP